MKIDLNHYALFREAAGCSRETVELDSPDAAALYDQVKTRLGVTLCRSQVRLALNDAFVDWSTPLSDGDTVVFIPPVAGG